MLRYWVWLVEGDFGYMYSATKPVLYDRVTIWVTPPGGGRPYQVSGRVDRVEDGH